MTPVEALRDIESHEFAARLNLVSGMRRFFHVAGMESSVKSLYDEMIKSGETREEVLGRIFDLCRLEIDHRYENPHDAALAVLLWLTAYGAPDYTRTAANVVDRTPQCWYAKKLARLLLYPPPIASNDSQVGQRPQAYLGETTSSGDATCTLTVAFHNDGPRIHHRPACIGSSTDGNTVVEVQH